MQYVDETTNIRKREFPRGVKRYIRKLHRSGVAVSTIAYRLDCDREQIERVVGKADEQPNVSSTAKRNRQRLGLEQ